LFPRAKIFAVTGQATSIGTNTELVRARIAKAAERAGRRSDEITLVAVSKTFPAEAIREAYAAGLRHFGENRVQEWESKRMALADLQATVHFLGHLQSNKARRAVNVFDRVDSVDSAGLAQKLHTAANDKGERLPVLVEVHLGGEATKSGANEADLLPLTQGVMALPHLELRGLMTIPPYFDDPEQARPFFRRLRELRDGLSQRLGSPLPALSMGMSHDFEVAIEEGATEIRIGSAIFGHRVTQE
jgi:pyridoxal phosphate enzyme (YggS family)